MLLFFSNYLFSSFAIHISSHHYDCSRYNNLTGEFTVPSGGAGLYFFHTSFFIIGGENGLFITRVNGMEVCRTESNTDVIGDGYIASNGFLTLLTEGET